MSFFALLYILIASLFFLETIRYYLPVIILLIPLSAYGIYKFSERFVRIRRLVVFILIFFASMNSISWNYLYLKTPTFILTHNWINKNIDVQTRIAYSGARYQTFTPSHEITKIIQEFNPGYYKRLSILTQSRENQNVRNIIYLSQFTGNSKLEKLDKMLQIYPVDYIIDYYSNPIDSLYFSNFERFELIKRFNPTKDNRIVNLPSALFDPGNSFKTSDTNADMSMYSLTRLGPYFDVLKIKNH